MCPKTPPISPLNAKRISIIIYISAWVHNTRTPHSYTKTPRNTNALQHKRTSIQTHIRRRQKQHHVQNCRTKTIINKEYTNLSWGVTFIVRLVQKNTVNNQNNIDGIHCICVGGVEKRSESANVQTKIDRKHIIENVLFFCIDKYFKYNIYLFIPTMLSVHYFCFKTRSCHSKNIQFITEDGIKTFS